MFSLSALVLSPLLSLYISLSLDVSLTRCLSPPHLLSSSLSRSLSPSLVVSPPLTRCLSLPHFLPQPLKLVSLPLTRCLSLPHSLSLSFVLWCVSYPPALTSSVSLSHSHSLSLTAHSRHDCFSRSLFQLPVPCTHDLPLSTRSLSPPLVVYLSRTRCLSHSMSLPPSLMLSSSLSRSLSPSLVVSPPLTRCLCSLPHSLPQPLKLVSLPLTRCLSLPHSLSLSFVLWCVSHPPALTSSVSLSHSHSLSLTAHSRHDCFSRSLSSRVLLT